MWHVLGKQSLTCCIVCCEKCPIGQCSEEEKERSSVLCQDTEGKTEGDEEGRDLRHEENLSSVVPFG